MISNQLDIYNLSDLQKVIESNVIENNIVIRGEQIPEILGVKKIIGNLGICDSNIYSLGELEEVTGDFWISSNTIYSNLKSLGKLRKIGGDANFRYSNLIDLGDLAEVGGKLSLRDTQLNDLSSLKFVGGDLYLPNRLSDNLDISKIDLFGKVRFWSDNESHKLLVPKNELGLLKFENEVPFWSSKYVYSIKDLQSANKSQKAFYRLFKHKFKNGEFLDIKGNYNYPFILLFDLLHDCNDLSKVSILKEYFKNLGKYYPKTAIYTSQAIINTLEKLQDFETAWELIKHQDFIDFQKVIEYEGRLNRELFDTDLIIKMCGYNHLTEFGKNNIAEVKHVVFQKINDLEKEKNKRFFKIFKNPKTRIHRIRAIIKEAEDAYRESIGMPKIGEGWISETELYYKISTYFKNEIVKQHASPVWLGRQHLDIYFPHFNIGIEYQGAQHYMAIDFFGGEEAYEKTRERDLTKKRKCEENGCRLIYVNEGYDFMSLVGQIQSVIEDVGK